MIPWGWSLTNFKSVLFVKDTNLNIIQQESFALNFFHLSFFYVLDSVALHFFNSSHDTKKITACLLRVCNKSYQMNRLEETEILSAKSARVNLSNDPAKIYINIFLDFFSRNYSSSSDI